MQRLWAKDQTGFTIVELLIVIVVIAILATISIVAYSGIQARARNASRLSEAQQLVKLVSAYKTLNDQYPPLPSGNIVCIGDGFSDLNSDGLGDCWDANKSTNNYHPYDPFNTALKAVGSLPTGERTPIASNGYLRLGPVFNGSAATSYVHYWLEGSSCPVGLLYWSDAVTVNCRIPIN